jgi:hypothetical protein
MQAKHREATGQLRPKYLTQSYLYNTASDCRRMAARLMRDADDASEEQARLMREEATRLLQAAKRFSQQADQAPSDCELPFG